MPELQRADRVALSCCRVVDGPGILTGLLPNWADAVSADRPSLRDDDDSSRIYRRRTHDPAQRHYLPVVCRRGDRPYRFSARIYRKCFLRHDAWADFVAARVAAMVCESRR